MLLAGLRSSSEDKMEIPSCFSIIAFPRYSFFFTSSATLCTFPVFMLEKIYETWFSCRSSGYLWNISICQMWRLVGGLGEGVRRLEKHLLEGKYFILKHFSATIGIFWMPNLPKIAKNSDYCLSWVLPEEPSTPICFL